MHSKWPVSSIFVFFSLSPVFGSNDQFEFGSASKSLWWNISKELFFQKNFLNDFIIYFGFKPVFASCSVLMSVNERNFDIRMGWSAINFVIGFTMWNFDVVFVSFNNYKFRRTWKSKIILMDNVAKVSFDSQLNQLKT